MQQLLPPIAQAWVQLWHQLKRPDSRDNSNKAMMCWEGLSALRPFLKRIEQETSMD